MAPAANPAGTTLESQARSVSVSPTSAAMSGRTAADMNQRPVRAAISSTGLSAM